MQTNEIKGKLLALFDRVPDDVKVGLTEVFEALADESDKVCNENARLTKMVGPDAKTFMQALVNECSAEIIKRRAAEARVKEMEAALAAEEKRSAELLRQLDKARGGNEPDFCYDPEEWEFTCDWDERDQVHGHGENLPLGGVMQVATLIRGPRKWVANVPTAWDEYGDPEDFEIKWFDSESEADAARSLSPIKEAGRG